MSFMEQVLIQGYHFDEKGNAYERGRARQCSSLHRSKSRVIFNIDMDVIDTVRCVTLRWLLLSVSTLDLGFLGTVDQSKNHERTNGVTNIQAAPRVCSDLFGWGRTSSASQVHGVLFRRLGGLVALSTGSFPCAEGQQDVVRLGSYLMLSTDEREIQ